MTTGLVDLASAGVQQATNPGRREVLTVAVKVAGLGPVDDLAKALHDVRCQAEGCAVSSRRRCFEWTAGRYVAEAAEVLRHLAGSTSTAPAHVTRDLPDELRRAA